ncbi:MAG: hypothetical protein PHZ02_00615 [Desulfocapsaceae bacterium]|nr:hypothetical protein [Desulfocapsaceae bacterium]
MKKRRDTVKIKIERLYPLVNGWMNFKVVPIFKEEPGYRRYKTPSGAFVMVSKKKREYRLAYNGDRFLEGTELNSFERDFPHKKYYEFGKMKKCYEAYMAIDPDE